MAFRHTLSQYHRTMRQRLLHWILPWLALSAAIFLAWMNPAVLNPTRLAWLLDGNDHGQQAIALAAYLRAPPAWPSLHVGLLAAPEGVPLGLIDGNPLLGLLLRPFASVLPSGLQFLGWWLLACIMLHTAFAAALLRRYTPNPLATWIGAGLLTLMPVLLARFGHVNLCAQWLILWALWVYVDPRRAAQPGWWVAVILTALLVHPYILIMVVAIWGSALLRQFALAPDAKARLALIGDAGIVIAPLLLVLLFVGTLNQPTMKIGDYGKYPMALDALWNPNIGTFSVFLPARSFDISQALEGMNYPGFGLLALIVIALVYAVRHRGDVRGDDLFRRLIWLTPAFFVLTVIALGPHLIWRGTVIASVPLSDWGRLLLDPVRASGRMFWPVLYTLSFAAIAMVGRMRFATLLLAGALLLQVIDTWPTLSSGRDSGGAAARPITYRVTRDPRWDRLIAQADMIEFEPPQVPNNLALLEEVTWRAIIAGKPVRFFYTSRDRVAIHRRQSADSVQFAMGHLDPRRLYVLLDGAAPSMVADKVQKLDGILIIPPSTPN